MILQALHALAKREHLMDDPDFEPKPVSWLVRVGRRGGLLGIEDTHTVQPSATARGKPKSVAKVLSVPREGGRTSSDRAYFFCDKAEYVFGLQPDSDKKRQPREKLAKRRNLFVDRVRACAEETRDEGAVAVARFLENIASGRQHVDLPEDCVSNDLFCFVYGPDIDEIVTARPLIREYWKAQRAAGSGDAVDHRCLVSGVSFGGEVGNFPQVKRVPGGSSSGVALVSFNSNAFESHGLRGNKNAPVSRDAAETCSTALRRLLDSAYPDPTHPGTTLPRWNVRIAADTAVCYWSAQVTGDEFASVFGGLLEANPAMVGEMYKSVWRGKKPEIRNPSAFYALTLSGTQGRIIVRDWFESTVEETAAKLARHFADIEIVRNTPPPKKVGHLPQMPIGLLVEAVGPRGKRDQAAAPLLAETLRAACCGTPYPLALLHRALLRERAEVSRSSWMDLNRRDARAAIIKGVLNRRRRFLGSGAQYTEVKPDMDPTNTSEGYVLGRLMAVLERLQLEAMGDPNASVIDRFFSGASASPKSVFVRLLKNARHHVRKMKDDQSKTGYGVILDRIIDDLASRFDPERNGFPAYLNLEQQGLFVLGYHQMRKWLWMSKDDRIEWQRRYPDAPTVYMGKTN